MPINLKTPAVETREQRLGTITQWEGSARQLARDSAFTYGCAKGCNPDARGQGGRRLCESSTPYSQASMCAEHIAVTNATIIQRSVVVQHAPIGCAASQSFTCRYYRDLAARRGWELEDPKSICTNLGEQDMVFGGVERLEQTIRAAFERHKPRVIFVATSCATGIIGDDVDGAARRVEAEIGIPVVTLHCEGFKSKHWSSGWDVIEHGILRRLVPTAPARQPDLINVIHLGGSDVFSPLLGPLGLKVNLVMGGSTLERLAAMSEASATVTMCFVLSYLATGLEQEFGIPEVKAPLPYGLDATDGWLRDIARITGREDRVEELIARERARINPELERLRRALKGKKGFVAAGAAFAHGLIADLRDLGVEVDGAFSFHHDPSTDSGDPRQDSLMHLVDTWGDVPNFTVSPDQHFQAHAALKRSKPDFVVCRHSGTTAVLAARLGIPVLPIFYSNDGIGYDGLITIGRAILRVLPRRRFYQDVASHSHFPYQPWWLEQTEPYAPILEPA
ncbi:nitrogenase component 1 [Blastochloris viridis]|uniref:Nitrogenase molybdenum-iron protein alpha chain n=1 Tax=Blastochloris viridis TaxID=1079 RepID=A0A0H5BHY7_BLAVI|nr:nitrogenase component 1 [Blastochloris viridis]ALK09361.1 Nitrogenase molybdenum-iron protein alpha chain [Blastochloris viridis]BAS00760.1 nitrogenase vanadium-cofactor synthesis protein VnfE [Blastochloris viridis]CUU42024.1 Nitrogenase molybdenum-iron protein alpha chain [Blastochloris viridis]